MREKDELLKQIYEASFAVVDLTLYLDTHPHDRNALEAFHEYQSRRKTALEAFEKKYYPLTVDGVTDHQKGWTWGEAPAPWLGGNTNVEL